MDYFSQSNWYPFPCCALEGRQKTSGSEEKDGFGSKEMGQGLGTLILWQFVLRTHRFLFSFCEGTDASTWWNFRSENSPCGCAPASMQACQTENGKDLGIWNCSCCFEKFDFTYFINGLAAVVCFEVSQNSAGGKKKNGASIWKGVRFFRAWSCVRQDLGHLWKKSIVFTNVMSQLMKFRNNHVAEVSLGKPSVALKAKWVREVLQPVS